jgi:hypothetical protein
MVDNTAQLPEVSYKHKYGDLGGIVPDGMDALDMGLLHRMGERSPLFLDLCRVKSRTDADC